MKKTNKFLYILLASGLLFSMNSCKNDSFLDRFPHTAFSEQTYFNTEEDLRLYANTFYNSLPEVVSYNGDNNSDNMLPRTADQLLAGTLAIPSSGGGWAVADWLPIRRCNYFLQRYENANVDQRDIYAAEVRFFRALFYWQKVNRFGDVPLVLRDLDDTSEELYGPRVNRNIVMDQVIADLEYAIQTLPDRGAQQTGRLNKDIANALLSRIALWEGTFRKYHGLENATPVLQKSISASEALMTGTYQIYSTGSPEEDYFNLFTQTDLSGNVESIMHSAYIVGLRTHNYTRQSGENNTGASKDFVDSYLFKDGKPIGATSYSYDDSKPDKEAENRDPRYKQTIATPDFVQDTDLNEPHGLPRIYTSQTTTGYWLIKGRSSDPIQWVAGQSDIDAFVFRYAEILLNYAEAKYEIEGTLSQADLDRSINQIRDRVGMPHLTTTVTADPNAIDYGYTISPLLYEIRRERRIELMGEGFRFNDIKRWKAGKLVEGIKTMRGMKLDNALKAEYGSDVNNIITDNNSLIIVNTNYTNGRQWDDKNYFFPIPIDQITLTQGQPGAYAQNPGW